MIELKNVTKRYKNGTIALDGIDLKIENAEFVFIVGGSGSGKSTLAKLLMKEEDPSSGEISVSVSDEKSEESFELSTLHHTKIPYYRRKIGLLFQDFRLLEDKTVYENIAFVLRALGKPSRTVRANVPTLLHRVGLDGKGPLYPDKITGEQKQRVALARALANDSNIIIADEPTGNIDPQMSYDIMDLLIGVHKRFNKTVIVFTHEAELARCFGQRIVSLDHGKIVSDLTGEQYSQDEMLPGSEK